MDLMYCVMVHPMIVIRQMTHSSCLWTWVTGSSGKIRESRGMVPTVGVR